MFNNIILRKKNIKLSIINIKKKKKKKKKSIINKINMHMCMIKIYYKLS